MTGVVNWRADAIKYQKNELFFDVVQDQSVMVSSTGREQGREREREGQWRRREDRNSRRESE